VMNYTEVICNKICMYSDASQCAILLEKGLFDDGIVNFFFKGL